MNPSQHAEQFQSQLANYVPQFTPQFWPVWLIIAGLLLVGMWLVLGLHALLRARGVKKSATDHGERIYLYSKAVRLWLKRRTKSAKAFQIKYENSNFRASIETVVLCMSVSFTFICLKNIHIISDIKIFS